MNTQEAELRARFDDIQRRGWAPIPVWDNLPRPITLTGCTEMQRLLDQVSNSAFSDAQLRQDLDWARQALTESKGRQYAGGALRATVASLWLIALGIFVAFNYPPPDQLSTYAIVALIGQIFALPLFFVASRIPRWKLNDRSKGKKPPQSGTSRELMNIGVDLGVFAGGNDGCTGCLIGLTVGVAWIVATMTVLFPPYVLLILLWNFIWYRAA